MIDTYLRATNEAALRAALIAAGLAVELGEDKTLVPIGCAIDIIGVIQKPTGKIIVVEGIDTPEMKPIPGYHANLRTSAALTETQTAALDSIIIEPPSTPSRVWF